jgi:hypothetical protein
MVGLVDCATNEYHTSGEAALPQNPFTPAKAVAGPPAFLKAPAVVVQVKAEVNDVAEQDELLPGCANAIKGVIKDRSNRKTPFLYKTGGNIGSFIGGYY